MENKEKRAANFYARMTGYGISTDDAYALRRIEMTLHRWAERECNGEVERDEKTGKTLACYGMNGPGPIKRYPTADKETGALKRLAAIMARYPSLLAYHQGDPRGCALYIVKDSDLFDKHSVKELEINCVYNRGLAVCY